MTKAPPAFRLHLVRSAPDGVDQYGVEIWLDTDVGIQDGLCIGVGATFEDAHRGALADLTDALKRLEQFEEPTP